MRHGSTLMIGGLMGILGGLVLAYLLGPDQYVSHAVIRITPAQVPANIAVSQPFPAPRLRVLAQQVRARTFLTDVVNEQGLYTAERTRMPMEDVVLRMRKDVTMGLAGDQPDTVEVSFRYADRHKARQVTRAVVNRFLLEYQRDREILAKGTAMFVKDRLKKAEADWQAASSETGVSPERKALNVATAKRHYESLLMKRYEAETSEVLEKRQQGGTMELLDDPSLPVNPEFRHSWLLLYGFIVGTLAALPVRWLLRRRPTGFTVHVPA